MRQKGLIMAKEGLSNLTPGRFPSHQDMMSKMRQPAGKKGTSESGVPPAHGSPEKDGVHITVHDHGDGTFHSEHHDGHTEEHPDHLHMTTHIAHHMAPGMMHHHSAHDGFSHQSHGVNEDGEHDGSHDHDNLDQLKDSMDTFLGEEAQEGKHDGSDGESDGGEDGYGGM